MRSCSVARASLTRTHTHPMYGELKQDLGCRVGRPSHDEGRGLRISLQFSHIHRDNKHLELFEDEEYDTCIS